MKEKQKRRIAGIYSFTSTIAPPVYLVDTDVTASAVIFRKNWLKFKSTSDRASKRIPTHTSSHSR